MHSPSYWFHGYFGDPERTAERFRFGERYYLTGDTAQTNEAGVFFFASRADDVITSSGYRIGPFEVESALIAHPAVAEVAVIGTPDELRVEAVTAYVVPRDGFEEGTELSGAAAICQDTSRQAPVSASRRILKQLPRTPSGKIKRTELRLDWAQRAGNLEAGETEPGASTAV